MSTIGEMMKEQGMITTPNVNYDLKEAFDREVRPLLDQLGEKLAEMGLPYLVSVGLRAEKPKNKDGEGGIGLISGYGFGPDNYMPAAMAMAVCAVMTEHSGCLSCMLKEFQKAGLENGEPMAIPKGGLAAALIGMLQKGAASQEPSHAAPAIQQAQEFKLGAEDRNIFGKS